MINLLILLFSKINLKKLDQSNRLCKLGLLYFQICHVTVGLCPLHPVETSPHRVEGVHRRAVARRHRRSLTQTPLCGWPLGLECHTRIGAGPGHVLLQPAMSQSQARGSPQPARACSLPPCGREHRPAAAMPSPCCGRHHSRSCGSRRRGADTQR